MSWATTVWWQKAGSRLIIWWIYEEERVVAHLPQPLLFMPIPLIAGIEVTCLQDYLLAGWS
jgi:hypothetical protein